MLLQHTMLSESSLLTDQDRQKESRQYANDKNCGEEFERRKTGLI